MPLLVPGNKKRYWVNMSRALHQQMEAEVPRRLADLLGVAPGRLRVEPGPGPGRRGAVAVDSIISAGNLAFVVAAKARGEVASVAMAARAARAFVEARRRKALPLVVVPFMGDAGRDLCAEAGVSWLDLSGNAHLEAPGLRVRVEGKPNLFRRAGRPRSVFAPRSARVARWLLMEPDHAMTQREIARAAGLDEGFTSRIVRHLEEQGLVARVAGGAVRAADPGSLLAAWREAYDFTKHHVLRGHVAARSSDAVLRQLCNHLRGLGVGHAATGLAAASLFQPFAGFRLVVVYVSRMPTREDLAATGFHEEPRGENVWLVVPNDEGVLHGASDLGGVRCVHPVQAYLDLKQHPERSAEAAEVLHKSLFRPGHA